jgi:hypothetical protein
LKKAVTVFEILSIYSQKNEKECRRLEGGGQKSKKKKSISVDNGSAS